MNDTAYAVGFIDRKTRKFLGVGVFSEPEPEGRNFPVILFKVTESDFQQAYDRALKTLATSPEYAWLRPFVEFKAGDLGRPGDGETPDIVERIEALEDRMDRVTDFLVLD